MSNLKSDRAGIIADVLIKHKVIKDVEELYEKNNYTYFSYPIMWM